MTQKNETRKEEIVRTAEMLFKQKGYSAVTMRDIAKAMGIKAASLYNHIQSKQEILSDIIITIGEQFTQGMAQIVAAEISSIEKLERIIALHVQITMENPSRMATMNNDWMHLEEQIEYYLTLRRNYEESFRQILKQGIESRELKTVDPEIILFSILSTLRSLYLWIPKREDILKEDLLGKLSKVLLTGVAL
ncbi:TetR/AcrR family transcriptional regulator [Kordia sp. YSTF-M3]|uniref:TetR/AcrR family transcriptional regulator n=1 Tax=Kordia aestuariivivens TaxID=2759037 RepID=A0ABR7QDT1_9FLAO|nr:TetR/AcrR family transcriptional regulator [Kordia aestuariivivens]MBC8756721.1 TetR/AcrR family transcriptional regulator [Kordia aestuariivivens]